MTNEEAIREIKWMIGSWQAEYAEDITLALEDIEALKMAITALEQQPCDKIINTIDFAIDATSGKDDYSVGMRNGMKYVKSLIDGKEPDYDKCEEQQPCESEQSCNNCGHGKAYKHGADITTMDDECGGCCSWNSKWIQKDSNEDCISREYILSKAHECRDDLADDEPCCVDADDIRKAPSVHPKAKVGHWIKHENPNYGQCELVSYECSRCGVWLGCQYFSRRSYCPNCGAKMESEDKE